MPVHDPPASISASDILEEANRTVWVPGAGYPTPSLTKARPLELINPDVDTNHQVGRSFGDGSVKWSDFYSWNTWRKPVVGRCEFIQRTNNTSANIRIAWEVIDGDPFRTGWGIYITDLEPSSYADLGDTPDFIRWFAPEYGGGKEYPSSGWFFRSYLDTGIYNGVWVRNYGETYSTTGLVIDFDVFARGDKIVMSALLSNTLAGSKFVTIVPFDGRQFHTLSDPNSDYDTSTNPTNISTYNKGDIIKADPESKYGNSDSGKSLQIYDVKASWNADVGIDTVVLTPVEDFATFDQLLEFSDYGYFWWMIYSTDPNFDPTGAPENTTQTIEQWWKVPLSSEIKLKSVDPSTGYDVWAVRADYSFNGGTPDNWQKIASVTTQSSDPSNWEQDAEYFGNKSPDNMNVIDEGSGSYSVEIFWTPAEVPSGATGFRLNYEGINYYDESSMTWSWADGYLKLTGFATNDPGSVAYGNDQDYVYGASVSYAPVA